MYYCCHSLIVISFLLDTLKLVQGEKSSSTLFKSRENPYLLSKWYYTMWKFHNFSITQILLEIKVGLFKDSKSTNFTHLESTISNFYEFLHFLKAQIPY